MRNFFRAGAIALLLAASVAPTLHAQALVNCIAATNTPCISSAQVGTGTQGEPNWKSFGKVNDNFSTLFGLLPTYGNAVGNVPQWVNFNGSGHIGLVSPDTTNGPTFNFKRGTTGAQDTADFFVHRAANYTGGSNAFVNSALNATTITTSGANSYEWTFSCILDNFNTLADASQNVCEAAHATQEAGGLTWARNASVISMTQDPAGGAVADEIDAYVNGTQANNNRVILHLVGGNNSGGHDFSANGPGHIRAGILLSPQNNDATKLAIDDAWIVAGGDYSLGMHFSGAPTANSTLLTDDRTGPSVTYGLNLGGTYTSAAIFLRDNKNIIWSTDQHSKTRYVSADSCLETNTQNTILWKICDDGHVEAPSGAIKPSSTAGITGTAVADSANAGAIGEFFSVDCGENSITGNASATITVTIASPAVVTWTSPPFAATGPTSYTCPINFTTSSALPTGLVAGTNYYIDGATVSGNTFQLSDTAAHALAGTNHVNTSGSQSGTQTGNMGFLATTATPGAGAGFNLTAGDWDCATYAVYSVLTALTQSGWFTGIGTSGTALPSAYNAMAVDRQTGTIGAVHTEKQIGSVRENVSSTTGIYSVEQAVFSAGTEQIASWLRCRRMR